MPRVPVLNPGERVRSESLRIGSTSARLDSDLFGGATGSQFQRASNQLTRNIQEIVIEEKRKADSLAVLEAQSNADSYTREILTDPNSGLLNKQGKNAFGIEDEFRDSYETRMNEIESGLSNDEQRAAFRQFRIQRADTAYTQINRHMTTQITAFDQEVTENSLQIAMEDAATNYRDPQRIGQSIQDQVQIIEDQATRLGLPNEYVKAKTDLVKSNTHAQVVDRMLANGEDLRAQAYYRQVKDQVLGSKAAQLERALEEGSLRGESQRQSDQIMSLGLSMDESLKKARSINDPKVRDETVRRLKGRFQEQAAVQAATKEKLYLEAVNLVEQNRGVPPSDLVPPSTWNQLSVPERKALESRFSAVANNDKAWMQFYEISLNPERLATMPQSEFEAKYWSKFDQAHRTRAENLRREAMDAQRSGQKSPKLSSTLTFNDRVTNTLGRHGFIKPGESPAKRSEAEASLFARFEEEAALRVENFELNELGGKRKATGSEIQKVIDGLIKEKVFIDNWFFDDEIPAFAVEEDEFGDVYVPYDRIPDDEKSYIQQLLRQNGQEVTDEKVEKIKGAHMLNDHDRAMRLLMGLED